MNVLREATTSSTVVSLMARAMIICLDFLAIARPQMR
jgi:hypothetical protein